MRIVCLLGRSGSGKSRVEGNLEKLGYNRSISYTTRKPGIGEVNGKDYHFVSRMDFFRLVRKHIIMEWAEYGGNLYGSPHPIGTINNVVTVEPNGYQAIKSIYGKQVIGVYIDVSAATAEQRALQRGRETMDELVIGISTRKNTDDVVFKDIENKVDLVVDGQQDLESITAEILKYILENN